MSLSAMTLRNLSDRAYDKRKSAALEIESKVKVSFLGGIPRYKHRQGGKARMRVLRGWKTAVPPHDADILIAGCQKPSPWCENLGRMDRESLLSPRPLHDPPRSWRGAPLFLCACQWPEEPPMHAQEIMQNGSGKDKHEVEKILNTLSKDFALSTQSNFRSTFPPSLPSNSPT